jgi:hypothetical protein
MLSTHHDHSTSIGTDILALTETLQNVLEPGYIKYAFAAPVLLKIIPSNSSVNTTTQKDIPQQPSVNLILSTITFHACST